MTDHHDPRLLRRPTSAYRLNRERLLRGAAGAMLRHVAAARRRVRRRLARPPAPPAAASAGTPVKGGTLRAGFVGGGTAETLNPLIGVTPIDQGRIQNLYDPLVLVNADLSTSPGLALEWNPQQRRDLVRGQAAPRRHVPQRQVVRRRRRDLLDPADGEAAPASRCRSSPAIDLKGLKKVNELTVVIPLTAPDADLAANFTYYNTWIIQDGETNFKNPVGTGPFMASTFTPGQQSLFKKNPNYWVSGQAVRRRAEDHLDRRPHRAPQRPAGRPDRRDGAAADRAGQGAAQAAGDIRC